jgi:hypothetical protein
MPDTLPVDPNVIVFRVVTPDIAPAEMPTPPIVDALIVVTPVNAPALITRPLIVFVAVGAVIAPKLTLPVVMIALHAAVVGAPTVSVCMFVPVVPVTVNVLAPLLIDDAVISPVNSVTPPIMLDALVVVMAPLAPSPLTFSVVPSHLSPEFALIVPGFDVVVIR